MEKKTCFEAKKCDGAFPFVPVVCCGIVVRRTTGVVQIRGVMPEKLAILRGEEGTGHDFVADIHCRYT